MEEGWRTEAGAWRREGGLRRQRRLRMGEDRGGNRERVERERDNNTIRLQFMKLLKFIVCYFTNRR